jgi:hypothetical protein
MPETNSANKMPTTATVTTKKALRGLLQAEFACKVPQSTTKNSMLDLVQKEREKRHSSESSQMWSVWNIIMTHDGSQSPFWRHFNDLRIIGKLAQVSTIFRYSVPENSLAWAAVCTMSFSISKTIAAEVFLLTKTELDNLEYFPVRTMLGYDMHLVEPFEVWQLACNKHKDAKALFSARRDLVKKRTKKGVRQQRLYWPRPFHDLTQREKDQLARAKFRAEADEKKRLKREAKQREKDEAAAVRRRVMEAKAQSQIERLAWQQEKRLSDPSHAINAVVQTMFLRLLELGPSCGYPSLEKRDITLAIRREIERTKPDDNNTQLSVIAAIDSVLRQLRGRRGGRGWQ